MVFAAFVSHHCIFSSNFEGCWIERKKKIRISARIRRWHRWDLKSSWRRPAFWEPTASPQLFWWGADATQPMERDVPRSAERNTWHSAATSPGEDGIHFSVFTEKQRRIVLNQWFSIVVFFPHSSLTTIVFTYSAGTSSFQETLPGFVAVSLCSNTLSLFLHQLCL